MVIEDHRDQKPPDRGGYPGGRPPDRGEGPLKEDILMEVGNPLEEEDTWWRAP